MDNEVVPCEKVLHLRWDVIVLGKDSLWCRKDHSGFHNEYWASVVASICVVLPWNKWLETVSIDASLLDDTASSSCVASFIVRNKNLREFSFIDLEECMNCRSLQAALLERPDLLMTSGTLMSSVTAALCRIKRTLHLRKPDTFRAALHLLSADVVDMGPRTTVPCIVFGSGYSHRKKTREGYTLVTTEMISEIKSYITSEGFSKSGARLNIQVLDGLEESAALMAQFIYQLMDASDEFWRWPVSSKYELKICLDAPSDLTALLDSVSYPRMKRMKSERLGSFISTSLPSDRSSLQLRELNFSSTRQMTPYTSDALLSLVANPLCALQVIKTIPDDFSNCFEHTLRDVLKKNRSVCKIVWARGDHHDIDFFCLRNRYQLGSGRVHIDSGLWIEGLMKCIAARDVRQRVSLLYYLFRKNPSMIIERQV